MTASLPVQDPAAPGVRGTKPPDGLDLDTRIHLAEQRLIAREQCLLVQARGLRQRLGWAATPRGRVWTLAGGAIAVTGLMWLARRTLHRVRRGGLGSAAWGGSDGKFGMGARLGGAPSRWLLSLLPMAWPLLPQRWRRRVSPATAAAVFSVAGPLLGRWTQRRR